MDALVIINRLNSAGQQTFGGSDTEWIQLDINRDDQISPIDALLVINQLHAPGSALRTGGGSSPIGNEETESDAWEDTLDAVFGELAG